MAQPLTPDQARSVRAAFVGTLIDEARRLAAEGLSPEAAVDLVLRQARLAVAASR